MIVGCQDDNVMVPFSDRMHKESVGIILVTVDIISILIIAKFFANLETINEEYCDKIDHITVQMKDFSVKINDV